MKSTFARAVTGAGIFFVAALPAFAAQAIKVEPAAFPSQAQVRASSQTHALPLNVTPDEVFANPDRSYPPSCLNAPLALNLYTNDSKSVTGLLSLRGDPVSTDPAESTFTESDTIVIFRVPCSGGKSAVLMEIIRPTNAAAYPYPIFPGVTIGSGYVPRIVADPNTFYSTTFAYDPVQVTQAYVFDRIYGVGDTTDFNQALSIFVTNLQSGSSETTELFPIPAYNPANYAAASQPLPISGYLTGTWYDSAHSGEGIQTEVGDFGTAGTQRFVSVSWYTYDATGTPYWLIGSGLITIGANSALVTLGYNTNGGFAGNFGSKATQALWGTINLSFPDCNTMTFDYATTGTGIPTGVPTGSGSKTWKRLTQVNGLTCQ
ncbi:MAG TPA: hypothetical protein VHW73_02535 [Rudaea sp.]|nr:hypothetical protein [Rudaea sp.]